MGFTFKSSKCRTLSIYRGKPTSVPFFLTDPNTQQQVQLKTLEDDPHKFLGALVTHTNTPKEHFTFLKEKSATVLGLIDKHKRADFFNSDNVILWRKKKETNKQTNVTLPNGFTKSRIKEDVLQSARKCPVAFPTWPCAFKTM